MSGKRNVSIMVVAFVALALVSVTSGASEWELSPSSERAQLADVSMQEGVITLTPRVEFKTVRVTINGLKARCSKRPTTRRQSHGASTIRKARLWQMGATASKYAFSPAYHRTNSSPVKQESAQRSSTEASPSRMVSSIPFAVLQSLKLMWRTFASRCKKILLRLTTIPFWLFPTRSQSVSTTQRSPEQNFICNSLAGLKSSSKSVLEHTGNRNRGPVANRGRDTLFTIGHDAEWDGHRAREYRD